MRISCNLNFHEEKLSPVSLSMEYIDVFECEEEDEYILTLR
jgi:hypothetical protein